MMTSVWTGSRRRDGRKQRSGDRTEWAGSVRFPKLQLEINDLVLTVTEEISRLHAQFGTLLCEGCQCLQLQLA